jgi:hypothetical protein
MSWRRFGALLRHLPLDSAFARQQLGEAAGWGVAEHLLASAVDALNGANWQRAGRRGSARPKPVQRPGVKGEGETFRGESVPLDEMKARFAARRAAWMAEAGEVS